jgi:transcription elongation GreA/GreB family factor
MTGLATAGPCTTGPIIFGQARHAPSSSWSAASARRVFLGAGKVGAEYILSGVTPWPDKAALRGDLARALEADLSVRERAYRAAREAATHEEARPENDKDTRALEQSYLARGEAQRVEGLRTALAEVADMPLRAFGPDDAIGLGALVATVDDDGVEARFWIASHGGGLRMAGIQIVTPRSPLGRALLGARTGDACELVLAGKTRSVTVTAVQ